MVSAELTSLQRNSKTVTFDQNLLQYTEEALHIFNIQKFEHKGINLQYLIM